MLITGQQMTTTIIVLIVAFVVSAVMCMEIACLAWVKESKIAYLHSLTQSGVECDELVQFVLDL